eukprot:c18710_g1_i1 orf=146-430(+)
MKQVFKLAAMFCLALALWIGLLHNEHLSFLPHHTLLLLPLYALVALGCYGLAMVGYGLMVFPSCPEEAVSLRKEIAEAKEFLEEHGIDLRPVHD